MDDDRFTIGEVYFHITYSGRGMRYPLIESLVYLGKNLSDKDIDNTWYFQPSSDYGRHGSALDHDATLERPVYSFSEREIADILDIANLASELERAAVRRVSR